MQKNTTNISYKQEILRKSIHLTSLIIPISYIFVDRFNAIMILLPITILTLLLDILSKRNDSVRNFVMKYFGKMLRPHELGEGFVLNGASWVLLSALLVISIFPKIIAVTAFTILIISDISAALIGRRYGKRPLFDKSWEGTLAFILSGILVVAIYWNIFSAPLVYFYIGSIGAIIGGFVEAASKKMNIDDNLSIPVSVGLIMLLGGYFTMQIGQPFLQIL